MASKELQAIVAAREHARAQGRRAALVTVVRTSGSTYRRPGARMLVIAPRDGDAPDTIGADFLGSISGGCLEDDAREHALRAISANRPTLVHYDTTAESDILFGTGAGCQGTVQTFIEPLPDSLSSPDPLTCIARALRERRSGVLASVIDTGPAPSATPLGAFLWVDAPTHGQTPITTNIPDPDLAAAIATDARAAAFQGRSETRAYPQTGGGHAEVFIAVIHPPHSLLICGAGQDALPLAHMAKELGWRVRVTDGRRAYLTHERFPDADELLPCPASEFGDRLTVEPGEAVVVMSHNYLHDRDLLRALVSSPAGYIGVLGPRQRTERLLADLSATDIANPPLDLGKFSLSHLHGPAGLDIGAESPEQIALSILAEIEASATGRDGGMLKRRSSPLHGPHGNDAR